MITAAVLILAAIGWLVYELMHAIPMPRDFDASPARQRGPR